MLLCHSFAIRHLARSSPEYQAHRHFEACSRLIIKRSETSYVTAVASATHLAVYVTGRLRHARCRRSLATSEIAAKTHGSLRCDFTAAELMSPRPVMSLVAGKRVWTRTVNLVVLRFALMIARSRICISYIAIYCI